MFLLKLAWKNIWRNRYRSIITISAIYFAVILSVFTSSLKTGVFDNLIRNVVSFYSGYIQVHKSGYWEEQILDNCFVNSSMLHDKIADQQNVDGIAARLESFALISSGEVSKGCIITGIEPENENNITSLANKIVAGSYLSIADSAILLSAGLAQRFSYSVNDTVILISQGYHGATAAGKFRIKGIVKFGSPQLNDKSLFMSLRQAQQFFGADSMITAFVLSLKNPDQVERMSKQIMSAIGSEYEVMTWEEMMPDIKQHIRTDSNNMFYIQLILYFLISFGIFSTLIMLMAERKYEMGMLVAVGMKKSKLSFLLITESVFTALSGCILGILTSIPIVLYFCKYPIRIGGETAKIYERFGFEAVFPASDNPSIFYTQAVIVLCIGLLLSLYPVIKLIWLDPVTAMKK